MSKGKNTVRVVTEAVAPIAEQMQLTLWDVLYLKEGPSWFLRIVIDRPGGVSMQNCEDLSRAIDALLDELDPCEQEYFLEVSSPGLGRILRTDKHLAAYTGQSVRLKLYRADENQSRTVTGTLIEYNTSDLILETETERRTLSRRQVSEIRANDDLDLM